MKVNKQIVEKRRHKIMQIIQQDSVVNVKDLAKNLNVSPLTIRRDLQYWEEKGAIKRSYGGAKLIQDFVDNDPLQSNEQYKHAIAKYATQYVQDGDTIFINTSSTALLMLKYIKNKKVTVITNNGKALLIDYDPSITIVLTGGELRTPKESMVGDFALNTLNKVTANKCFLGCSGFDIQAGMTTAILQEVSINETMVRRCKGEVFLLADHSKIGNVHDFSVADIHAFSYIITDELANEEIITQLQQEKINVIKLAPLLNYIK